MKQLCSFLMCWLIIFSVTACDSTSTENQEPSTNSSIQDASLESEKPEKLVIYISSGIAGFSTDDGSSKMLYPSPYSVGMKSIDGELGTSNGNIFEKALQQYSKTTGIEIEIHFLEEPFEATEGNDYGNTMAAIWNEAEETPDMLILNRYQSFDYYRWLEQGLLIDFSSYTEKDEMIADNSYYYQNVLAGGQIKNRQYILPILFNLNGFITTSDFLWETNSLSLMENISYEEMLQVFEDICEITESDKYKEALYETSGRLFNGAYIPSILSSAAYTEFFNNALSETLVSEEISSEILGVMERFIKQEYRNVLNAQDMTYQELVFEHSLAGKWYASGLSTNTIDSIEEVGIFLSGGGGGGASLYNSLLTDAAYFYSQYKDRGKQLVIGGIPSIKGIETYSANLSAFAVGLTTTDYPKEVYELWRYLIDYEYPMFYGFSTNRQITEKQLSEIQNTEITIPPDNWLTFASGQLSSDFLDGYTEGIGPLPEEYVQIIKDMLDNMVGASIPFYILESDIYTEALIKVIDKEMTLNEAGVWITQELQDYLGIMITLDPFFDWNFETRYMEESIGFDS